MTRSTRWRLCALILIFVVPSPALAYEVGEIKNGGTITGAVTLLGPVPEPKGFNLVTFPDPEYCGRISNGDGWRLLYDFTVGAGGRIQDVVVMLDGIQKGKPFSMSIPRVMARDCQFLPFTNVVRDGHGVEVVNMDPVMHDVQAYETSRRLGARVLFNSPLPMNHEHKRGDLHATHDHRPGKSMVQQFHLSKGRRIFVMQCGFHAYMESWAFAVDNPYYAMTDSQGQYAIDQVPPGTYRLQAWHPQIKGVAERTVTIEPGGTLSVDFQLKAPIGRRTAHTVQRPSRFGLGALGRPLTILPTVKRQ